MTSPAWKETLKKKQMKEAREQDYDIEPEPKYKKKTRKSKTTTHAKGSHEEQESIAEHKRRREKRELERNIIPSLEPLLKKEAPVRTKITLKIKETRYNKPAVKKTIKKPKPKNSKAPGKKKKKPVAYNESIQRFFKENKKESPKSSDSDLSSEGGYISARSSHEKDPEYGEGKNKHKAEGHKSGKNAKKKRRKDRGQIETLLNNKRIREFSLSTRAQWSSGDTL